MNRQAIDSGGWFDRDSATKYSGVDTDWHGQHLYKTVSGKWIIWYYSCVQGESDRWIVVDTAAAVRWLIKNKYDGELDTLGPDIQAELEATEV